VLKLQASQQTGYSLIELLTSVAISSLLLIAASSMVMTQQQLLSQQINDVQLSLETTQLVNLLRSEARRTGYHPGSIATKPAVYYQADQIGFGYFTDNDQFKRIAFKADTSVKKLKVCTDTLALVLPLENTCRDNINYSLLNERLVALNSMQILRLPSSEALYQANLNIGLKKQIGLDSTELTVQVILAPRNGQ
jgi:prepilin-type N-terminal cleavage/methylation domain-containing protein